MKEKKLFLALSVEASSPLNWEGEKMILEKNRHITLSFLGNQEENRIKALLDQIVVPSIGFAGICTDILFLPEKRPHVVAWEVDWLSQASRFEQFRQHIESILDKEEVDRKNEKRPFFPHITIGRNPREKEKWISSFCPIPFCTPSFCLFQSLGNSEYKKLWEKKSLLPYEEFPHTADLAFYIRGYSLRDLHFHAQLALASFFPPILEFMQASQDNCSIDEAIFRLNEVITKADIEMGTPFKAVSHHGDLSQEEDHMIWELIIDV